jgi:Fungal specific transcription factor domain
MKFQDEGPRLRQRYERKLSGAEEDDRVGTSDEWTDRSSSSSSGASRYPSPGPGTPGVWDGTGLDVIPGQELKLIGLVEDPSFIPMSESVKDYFMQDGTRAVTLFNSGRLSDAMTFQAIKLNPTLYSPTLQQQQLLYTFTSSMAIPSTHVLEPAMRNLGRLFDHLPSLAGTHPLLDTAVRALTLAHLGRLQSSEDLMAQSRPFYGKALRLLNAALLDETQGMASETLSATILLSFYEMFASDSNESWVRHAGGAGTLMRIRGPARHRYGFDREIFLAYRHALVIEAFQQENPCFLNEPEWRQLSQQIHDDIRTSGGVGDRMEIFNITDTFFMEMVEIPGLMYDARNLKLRVASPGEHESAKEAIIKRATKHRENLKGIFARFSSALRNLGHAPSSYMSGDPVFPIYYKYVNIFAASSHTGHWTLLMLLNMLLREMDPDGEKASLYAMENREAALDCCRSAPFMEKSSFIGPFFAIYALRLSLAVLEPKQEREWVIQKLFHIGNTNLAMAKHLPPSRSLPRVRAALEENDRTEMSEQV